MLGLADVVPVTKGSPSLDVGDYRPISITLLLPKVLEKIVAGKLSHFLMSSSLLPPSQFSYRNGLHGNMCCFLHIISPSTSCFGQGHGEKVCSVGPLSCI